MDRLFDLKHASRLDQLESAARALGLHLEVRVAQALSRHNSRSVESFLDSPVRQASCGLRYDRESWEPENRDARCPFTGYGEGLLPPRLIDEDFSAIGGTAVAAAAKQHHSKGVTP